MKTERSLSSSARPLPASYARRDPKIPQWACCAAVILVLAWPAHGRGEGLSLPTCSTGLPERSTCTPPATPGAEQGGAPVPTEPPPEPTILCACVTLEDILPGEPIVYRGPPPRAWG